MKIRELDNAEKIRELDNAEIYKMAVKMNGLTHGSHVPIARCDLGWCNKPSKSNPRKVEVFICGGHDWTEYRVVLEYSSDFDTIKRVAFEAETLFLSLNLASGFIALLPRPGYEEMELARRVAEAEANTYMRKLRRYAIQQGY